MSQSYSGVNSNLLIDVETQLGLSIYDVQASLTTGLKQLSSLTAIYRQLYVSIEIVCKH